VVHILEGSSSSNQRQQQQQPKPPPTPDFDKLDNKFLVCFHCGEKGHKAYIGKCQALTAGRQQNAAGRKVYADYQARSGKSDPYVAHTHPLDSSSSSAANRHSSNSSAASASNSSNRSQPGNKHAPVAVDDNVHVVFIPSQTTQTQKQEAVEVSVNRTVATVYESDEIADIMSKENTSSLVRCECESEWCWCVCYA
jgi:hypothetical protein